MPYSDVNPATTSSAEKLAEVILANFDDPSKGNTIDVPAPVESLLQSLGVTTSDSGGRVNDAASEVTIFFPAIRSDLDLDRSLRYWARPNDEPRGAPVAACCSRRADRLSLGRLLF
jgi:hypothetical protein